MATIFERDAYRYRGQDYFSLQSLHIAIDNELGALVDRIGSEKGPLLGPSDKIAIFDWLKTSRVDIADVLESLRQLDEIKAD